jgi:hypothetical protein
VIAYGLRSSNCPGSVPTSVCGTNPTRMKRLPYLLGAVHVYGQTCLVLLRTFVIFLRRKCRRPCRGSPSRRRYRGVVAGLLQREQFKGLAWSWHIQWLRGGLYRPRLALHREDSATVETTKYLRPHASTVRQNSVDFRTGSITDLFAVRESHSRSRFLRC